MGITELIDLVLSLKAKIMGISSISMVAYYVEKTFSQIIGHLFDTTKR